MPTYKFKEYIPRVHPSAYVDCNSRIIGNVKVGRNTAIYYGTIVRGDEGEVEIGDNVAILENCIIEAPEDKPVRINDNTLISHGAIIHGAIIGKYCLVGIGAIVLDGAIVEDESIIAAGAVVPPNTVVKRRSIVGGIPARLLREVTAKDLEILKRELEKVISKTEEYRRSIECG